MSVPPELARFARASSGVSSLEYAVLVALIAIAVSAGLTVLGDEIRSGITSIAARLPAITALVGGP